MRSMVTWGSGRVYARQLAAMFALVTTLEGCINGEGIKPETSLVDAGSLDAGRALKAENENTQWPSGAWWQEWHDPQLDRLMARVVAGNPSLGIARSRVTAAIWRTRELHANELPTINSSVDLERTRFARYDNPSPPGGMNTWNNAAALDLSYDLDLWGKNRALEQGALDSVQAATMDMHFAKVELQTAVARTYNQLALDYALLDIYVAINDEKERNLDIATKRRTAGIGTEIDVSQANSEYYAGVADIQRTENEIAIARLQIAYFVGEGPGFGDSLSRPSPPGKIQSGLPSSLPAEIIEHRPDVIAQRWRIAEAAESMKAVHADFYPDIRIAASASLASVAPFGGFFNFVNSDGLGHSIGVTGMLPIFDADRRRGRYGIATAEYDDAVLKYNDTVFAALQGVAQSVTSMHSLETQGVSAESALVSSRRAYQLAQTGYRGGLTEYLDVLVAQKVMLQQEINLTLIQSSWVDRWIVLMKELGGGADIVALAPKVASGDVDAD